MNPLLKTVICYAIQPNYHPLLTNTTNYATSNITINTLIKSRIFIANDCQWTDANIQFQFYFLLSVTNNRESINHVRMKSSREQLVLEGKMRYHLMCLELNNITFVITLKNTSIQKKRRDGDTFYQAPIYTFSLNRQLHFYYI